MTVGLALLRGHLANHPLAVTEEMASSIRAVLERRSAGIRLPDEELEVFRHNAKHLNGVPNGTLMIADLTASGDYMGLKDYEAARSSDSPPGAGTIAVINIIGIMGQHSYQVEDISGPRGTSADRVAAAIKQAAADPNIGGILLRIDSPGGSVFGIENLGNVIHGVRGQKPIWAQADSVAASAAYWTASAADQLIVTPGGMVGSIGVVCLHGEASKAEEEIGLKFTYIYAGERKVWGNPHEPLAEGARESLQANVDAYYSGFISAVARGRGVSEAVVRRDFGKGDTLLAGDAVKVGMADRVEPMDATLRRLSKHIATGGKNKAEEPDAPIVAVDPPVDPVAEEQRLAAEAEAAQLAADQDHFRRRRFAMRKSAAI